MSTSTVASTRPRPLRASRRLYLDDLDDLSRELHLLDRALEAMMASDSWSEEDMPSLAWQLVRCRELVRDLQWPARGTLTALIEPGSQRRSVTSSGQPGTVGVITRDQLEDARPVDRQSNGPVPRRG